MLQEKRYGAFEMHIAVKDEAITETKNPSKTQASIIEEIRNGGSEIVSRPALVRYLREATANTEPWYQ